jgi:hypothetical protein
MPLARDTVLQRLSVDLIGPDAPDELVRDRPSDLYLTGMLWPRETRMGGEDLDRLGAGEGGDTGPEGGEEDAVPLSGGMRPCAAGLSFAVSGKAVISIAFEFGLYEQEETDDGETGWRRRQISGTIAGVECRRTSAEFPLEDDGAPSGVFLHVRSAPWPARDALLVTVTLVNAAVPEKKGRVETERLTLFQTKVRVTPSEGAGLVPRPVRRAVIDDDDRSAALLYRGAHEFAVGHTCSATWVAEGTTASEVATSWIPTACVPAVSADGHSLFSELRKGKERVLDAAWLANADDAELGGALHRVPEIYRKWIALQEGTVATLDPDLQITARRHLAECFRVAERMEDGARRISHDAALAAAFRLANEAMNIQSSWAQRLQEPVAAAKPLLWRPFQLGFLLLAACSAADPDDADRQTMDLLWFPTGGGKTEAYLGLIAFVAFARRLRGVGRGGVTALMRYTLRLLTTQQFSRAAAMILACEAIRRRRVPARDGGLDLGSAPFGIGLWVGGDATPNKVSVAARVLAGQQGPSPVQLTTCPACGNDLRWTAREGKRNPVAIDACCIHRGCLLQDDSRPLPVYTVDEDIYRAKPTLLLATVDKFAQVVRKGEVGSLLDAGGDAPPELVIQDELHLISGPLGTLVGLYEAGIDRLMWRKGRLPKVVGSTATIRRAADQISALFDRRVCQFPPPAIDAGDSGFAVRDETSPGRLYAAVTTAGRSAKFTLQAVAGSLLQSAEGGLAPSEKDPYWTLVGYFNALRELGGAFVLMQDDVPDSIALYARRRGETARRTGAIEELTSRRTQVHVRDMLRLMDTPADRDSALDAVLATNMLSVGVDIPRLGLMVVNGQPKGVAEYIQATSRVGRRHPGLVVAVLNNAKARDRSHYEAFRTWHDTLYRDVEATSVTPFASRARDRALHAALIAAARHLVPGLSDRPALDQSQLAAVQVLIQDTVRRAGDVDPGETAVAAELSGFLNRWQVRRARSWWNDRDPGHSLLVSAETAAELRAQGRDARGAIPTPNSMRNVEPGVPFRFTPALAARAQEPGSGDQ